MTRTYSSDTTAEDIAQLNLLADKTATATAYQKAMIQLGNALGRVIVEKIADRNTSAYVACTVEDADYLAKGVLTALQPNLSTIALACFWNKRFSPFDIPDLKVAPILKEYTEPVPSKVDNLVVIKSIISGGCVVRTNLTRLIDSIDPNRIFVVAPVLYRGAQKRLSNAFLPSINSKFDFIYFAEDDERLHTGEVLPGVGGMVYERLGFSGQDDKNHYSPEIVRTRRHQLVFNRTSS